MRFGLTFESKALHLLLSIFYSTVEIKCGFQCVFFGFDDKSIDEGKDFSWRKQLHYLQQQILFLEEANVESSTWLYST